MKHVIDEVYNGHELVFMQQLPSDKAEGYIPDMFAVDIRADDDDGEFIGAYCDMLSISDARLKAVGFVDGYDQQINDNWREERRQGRIDT